MSIVSFQNPGLIPIEAITVMGINAKENDNAIGFFGTGLKYSIAALLRTDQKITIWRGLEKYNFQVRQIEVRGKEFGFIWMRMDPTSAEQNHLHDWERLGFTTHLGAKWQQWQIFRELYSNTLDEFGDLEYNYRSPKEGFTTIIVEGEAFFAAAKEKDKIFLETAPLYTDGCVEIHEKQNFDVYYRGVKAYTLDKPTKHTFNIIEALELTEDRTIKNEWYLTYYITRAIMLCDNVDIIEKSLFHEKGFEGNLDYTVIDLPDASLFPRKVLDLAEREFMAVIPLKALTASEKWAQSRAEVRPYKLSSYESEQLTEALSFLEEIGFTVTEEIVVTHSLGPDVYGLARNEKILLAKATLDKGGNWLVGTILEEHLHITQGFTDESRRFQNFLFDLAIRFAREASSLRKALS